MKDRIASYKSAKKLGADKLSDSEEDEYSFESQEPLIESIVDALVGAN